MSDRVSIQIQSRLRGLSQVSPEKSIFKVHNQIPMVNENAYKPECVAIGPYHYHDDRLHYMNEQKWRNLQQMLKRKTEPSVHRYVQALMKIEVEVRQQYGGIINLTQQEFIEMMLLDGCFIIEYFRNYRLMGTPRGEIDSLLSAVWTRRSIGRDLLLLENQLPFKVLTTLHDLTEDDCRVDAHADLIYLVKVSLGLPWHLSPEIRQCKHLLDLVYQLMISRVSQREPSEYKLISSATELKGLGIKFKSVKDRNILDIQFNNGTLEIPTIFVGGHTEALLRNLVAYEHYCQDKEINYVTDYLKFIDCLVNTPEDVRLLCQKGVIDNYLGDDEVVSTMFNKMGDYTFLPNFYYANIFNELNRHCETRRIYWMVRRNRWMAILKKEYFHSPWALISFLAAIMLLLLALTQTIYTVMSFYKRN